VLSHNFARPPDLLYPQDGAVSRAGAEPLASQVAAANPDRCLVLRPLRDGHLLEHHGNRRLVPVSSERLLARVVDRQPPIGVDDVGRLWVDVRLSCAREQVAPPARLTRSAQPAQHAAEARLEAGVREEIPRRPRGDGKPNRGMARWPPSGDELQRLADGLATVVIAEAHLDRARDRPEGLQHQVGRATQSPRCGGNVNILQHHLAVHEHGDGGMGRGGAPARLG